MDTTGKTIELTFEDRPLKLCNQRCRAWTYPYAYLDGDENLSQAGCGIFSIVYASRWLTGVFHAPEKFAQFSVSHGGRGDDGTDRPALLQAMMDTGLNREYGFSYHGDGLRNDSERVTAFERKAVELSRLTPEADIYLLAVQNNTVHI